MQKRNLGNTDIQLTSIGFGGAPLGNLFEELNEPECFNIFSSEQNNADRYDYWSSPEHLLKFEPMTAGV